MSMRYPTKTHLHEVSKIRGGTYYRTYPFLLSDNIVRDMLFIGFKMCNFLLNCRIFTFIRQFRTVLLPHFYTCRLVRKLRILAPLSHNFYITQNTIISVSFCQSLWMAVIVDSVKPGKHFLLSKRIIDTCINASCVNASILLRITTLSRQKWVNCNS